MIFLLDNFDSFTYNIYQYVAQLGYSCQVKRNNEISVEQIRSLKPSALILSPGPGRPENAGILLSLVQEFFGEIPILGICLGHQAIGQACGGFTIHAPEIVHGKLSLISHTGAGLFKGLSSPLSVMRYHSLVIDPHRLPDTLEVTATASDGTIMGVRHKKYPVEGIQFHPESFATEYGAQMFQNFLEANH